MLLVAAPASAATTAYVQGGLMMDDRLTVQGALARLPDQSHDILHRFFARDQSYGQIGTETGLPAGTIASRISRALARLHAELAPGN